MTHLFQRLARRTRDANRTVRPVTPPLFIPVGNASHRPIATAPPAPAAPTGQQAPPRPTREAREHARRGERATATPPPPLQASPPPVQPPSEIPASVSERMPPTERVATPAAPARTARAKIEPAASAVSAMTPDPLRTDPPDVPGAPERNDDGHKPAAQIVPTPAREIVRSQFAPPPPRAAAVSDRPRSQRERYAAAPPPTIEVTIGRIEVRTQPPPAKRPARPPRQPAMTLDAYAAERKAGRR